MMSCKFVSKQTWAHDLIVFKSNNILLLPKNFTSNRIMHFYMTKSNNINVTESWGEQDLKHAYAYSLYWWIRYRASSMHITVI